MNNKNEIYNKYNYDYCFGYQKCKDEMEEIIESMAYEIFMRRNPYAYFCPEKEKLEIMKEFGWKE